LKGEHTMLNFIRKNILEFVDVAEDSITEETSFINDLHMNSYDIVSMIGKIESELNTEIPDIDIRDLQTVGDLCKYLIKKMG
jgi:acyl carrier protein